MQEFINKFNELMYEYTNEMNEVMKLQTVLPERKFKKVFNFHMKQHKLKMKQFFKQHR